MWQIKKDDHQALERGCFGLIMKFTYVDVRASGADSDGLVAVSVC